jgi:hypothetical protein
MAVSLLGFAQSVKASSCRVRNTLNLIFLCGGPKQNPKLPTPFRSARDYFFRHVQNTPTIATRVRLAEDIGLWQDHETFTDLLEVEEYVAALADLIILFVESPGSVAELGAFSALTAVQPKLLAVVNKHFKEPSFISEGPVRRLKFKNSPIYEYTWNPSSRLLNAEKNLGVFNDLSEDICDLLQRREQAFQKEQTLDLTLHGHTMLMVADLIDIAFAATITDIHECLKAVGKDILLSHLQKYLFLLTDLSIIRTEYLDGPLYVSKGKGPYILYDFLEGAQVKNRERAKVEIRSQLEGTRKRILHRHLKELRQKGVVTEGEGV